MEAPSTKSIAISGLSAPGAGETMKGVTTAHVPDGECAIDPAAIEFSHEVNM